MKEDICSIPISELFEPKEGCPLCRMDKMLEDRLAEYITGAAMMEPDVRIKTNEQGFCGEHLEMLLESANKLSLALMLQTHLEALSKKLYADSVPLLKKSPDPKKQLAVLEKKRRSCYLCARINEFMNATYSAFAYMYKSDGEFDKRIRQQPYFCLKHMRLLMEAGARELSKDACREFCKTLNDVNSAYAEALAGDIDWFCKKFDYRYKDEDWKNSKDSVERAVRYLK